MLAPERVVILAPLEGSFEGDSTLRFRLTYDGPLRATQRDPREGERHRMAPHKHALRQAFHRQLKQLWATHKNLCDLSAFTNDYGQLEYQGETRARIEDLLPNLYQRDGFRYIPLVREDWSLQCDLDILFLRRDPPGSLIRAGDIDNRVKTLIDALRLPANAMELDGAIPGEGEDPFYCLMEDDNQVTGLRVETDRLLDGGDAARVQLIVTVDVHPYKATNFNSAFDSR